MSSRVHRSQDTDSAAGPPPAESWLAGLRAGDPAIVSAIFTTYYERLCGVVQAHVRSRAITEEIVQELFLRIWRGRDRLEIRDSLQGYLLRAARNASLTHVRRARMEATGLRVPEQSPRLVPTAEEVVSERALTHAIDAAIAELPERCRLVYTMRRVHGLSYADIAAALEISPKTVETQMTRALRKLRDKLSDYLPESSHV